MSFFRGEEQHLSFLLIHFFMHAATGTSSSQCTLGGQNTQTEFLVLLWPLTSLLEGNYPKAPSPTGDNEGPD